MAANFRTVTRSLITSSTSSYFLRRAPPSAAPRLRPSPSSSRRSGLPFSPPRSFGELGCVQSFLLFSTAPMPRLTAHLSTDMRAFCELYHGS